MSPSAPRRPCKEYGCPETVVKGYCPAHQHIQAKVKHDRNVWKGSAHSRGYGLTWRKLRSRILLRDKVCTGGWDITCGGRNLSTQCDHIVRKVDGGTDDASNLQGLCYACHRMKTSFELMGRPLPARVQFEIP